MNSTHIEFHHNHSLPQEKKIVKTQSFPITTIGRKDDRSTIIHRYAGTVTTWNRFVIPLTASASPRFPSALTNFIRRVSSRGTSRHDARQLFMPPRRGNTTAMQRCLGLTESRLLYSVQTPYTLYLTLFTAHRRVLVCNYCPRYGE